jgi:voltage-gated potassium channel Kch
MTPRELRGELIYFSVVTISTVGYGDILPASPVARMLAMTEAVVGQFFVAVVVATFVSMYTTQAIEARVQARQQNPNAPPRD